MSVYPFSLLAIEALSGLRKSLTKSQISASGFKSVLFVSNLPYRPRKKSLFKRATAQLTVCYPSRIWHFSLFTFPFLYSIFEYKPLQFPFSASSRVQSHTLAKYFLITHTYKTHPHTHTQNVLSQYNDSHVSSFSSDAFSAKKKVKQGPKMCHRCNLFRCIISGYKAITIWRC